MATRKNTAAEVTEPTEVETEGYADTEAPVADKPARKPRAPKAVTDLPTASAAFNRAKRVAERADKALDAARADAEAAHKLLADAATALDGYLGEVRNAVAAELPTEVPAEG